MEQELTRSLIAQQSKGVFIPSGPLCVDSTFYFPFDDVHQIEDGWYTKPPDRDNLDKFYLDCLSKVVIVDDRYVCDGRLQKKYSKNPRVEICIKTL